MKSAVKLEIEVANLLGWIEDLKHAVKHHEFSYAAEMSVLFKVQCYRVNHIANDLADEDDSDEN